MSTRSLALAALLPLVSVSCGGRGSGTTSSPAGSGSELADQVLVQAQDLPAGLELRVSLLAVGPPAFDHAKLAPAKKLSDAEAGALVSRAKPFAVDAQDLQRFALRGKSLKAGSRVRVRLTLVNESRRYHVALVDPLPAGLETMNPALAVTGPIPQDPGAQQARGAYWWWYGPWYEHQNLRDERVEAFASLLWEGVHKYDYVARATTPGSFVVPPPRAEEMYMPETLGRGASDRVVIE